MYNWVVEILPFIDQQDLSNAWNRTGPVGFVRQHHRALFVPEHQRPTPGQPSNYEIGSTSLGVLKCPDDTTAEPGHGNLSYVVNGGFSLVAGAADRVDGVRDRRPADGQLVRCFGDALGLGVAGLGRGC